MSGIQEGLAAEFANIADNLQREITKLVDQQARTKKNDPQKKSALDAAKLAVERLGSFNFRVLGQIQCPQCWIWNGVQSTLLHDGWIVGTAEIFRCPKCRYDLQMPMPTS